MFKKALRDRKMSDVAYLDNAERWSKDLTKMRSRGPGDVENAMRSVARDYDVEYGTIWKLRYRKGAIKDIGVSTYMKLQAAYQAECERQLRKLEHEIQVTEAIAGPDCDVVIAAKALVGEGT